MKKKSYNSLLMTIGITLVLVAVLLKRLFIKSYSLDSLFSFLGGFAVILICALILRIALKKQK